MRHPRIVWVTLAVASIAALPALAATALPVTERERFEAEQAFRNRQQALAESDQALRKADLDLRREEQNQSRWTSPLVLAIVAAAIAALGSAVVAFVNGRQQRKLERERSEASRTLEREKAENQIKLERDKAQAQLRLDARQAESDRILEVIKTGESEAAAANLQFLLSAGLVAQSGLGKRLATYLAARKPGTGPNLPAADGRFRFEKGPETSTDIADLEVSLRRFCDYLDQVGFARPDHEVSIGFDDDTDPFYDGSNAYYDAERKRVVIGTMWRSDPFAAYRQYMHHVLMEAPAAPAYEDIGAISIESGLADYFPASYMGTPFLGAIGARELKLDRPFVRSLTSTEGFADLAEDTGFQNAQIWGSLFWDIRTALGQAVTDRLMLAAWTGTHWPADSAKAPQAFLATLLADPAASGKAAKAIKDRLKGRGFPVPKASGSAAAQV